MPVKFQHLGGWFQRFVSASAAVVIVLPLLLGLFSSGLKAEEAALLADLQTSICASGQLSQDNDNNSQHENIAKCCVVCVSTIGQIGSAAEAQRPSHTLLTTEINAWPFLPAPLARKHDVNDNAPRGPPAI